MQKFFISQQAAWIKDGKCLIVESAKSPGYFGLPGGRINIGEQQDVAFARELKEELNLDKFEKLAVCDYLAFYDVPSGRHLENPVCAVISLIKSEQEATNNDPVENSQHVWVSEDEINNYKYYCYNLDQSIKKAFVIYNSLYK